jgi:hypothetical protein
MTEINWNDQPLGELPDAALAARLGTNPSRVATARRGLGVPGYRTAGPAPTRPAVGPIDWSKQPLGELPDAALATLLGVSRTRVYDARRKRGIPLFVANEDSLASAGLERDARWYSHATAAESCRYCVEAVKRGSLRARARIVRWTDQGACCAAHYGALPACASCPAPVSSPGELCDDCITRLARAEREACGWRCAAPSMASSVDRGDIEIVKRGLERFERRRETKEEKGNTL